eukprot:8733225-Prorocentrum_lima.AAC.1
MRHAYSAKRLFSLRIKALLREAKHNRRRLRLAKQLGNKAVRLGRQLIARVEEITAERDRLQAELRVEQAIA